MLLLLVSTVLLVLGVGYLWLDGMVRRQEAERLSQPRPTYRCRQCGRAVDMGATVRPIRLTLLCPDDYRAQYGALCPLPGPKPRRAGTRRTGGPPTVPIPPRR